ncbi:cupin domain-containing protein [Paenibacillus endoradicis]|uniref:cupin domain-containing protein n=1 Tax=Paenibacillus endoradicis TaxID=2972487 RepID=UPI002159537F|nr:cupin domain-containing protein [Paenibacillus endoradicis]MCR8657819.1 cupin domain-containing protein [Paenibacillus endoradicis]
MDITKILAAKVDQLPVYKISPKDTNKFVLLTDGDHYPFMNCIEIFDIGGKTPPNKHDTAFEHFYVLFGEGIAIVGNEEIPVSAGAHIVVPRGFDHALVNTGNTRLYTLTTMIPDDGFSTLIKSGIQLNLDEEDLKILCPKG